MDEGPARNGSKPSQPSPRRFRTAFGCCVRIPNERSMSEPSKRPRKREILESGGCVGLSRAAGRGIDCALAKRICPRLLMARQIRLLTLASIAAATTFECSSPTVPDARLSTDVNAARRATLARAGGLDGQSDRTEGRGAQRGRVRRAAHANRSAGRPRLGGADRGGASARRFASGSTSRSTAEMELCTRSAPIHTRPTRSAIRSMLRSSVLA
jgi:hypothetical protein